MLLIIVPLFHKQTFDARGLFYYFFTRYVTVRLAIFDLDNTLIANDSDFLWGQFMVDQGIVDKDIYETTNAKFYDDYKLGQLDMVEFLNFALKPLGEYATDRLYQWRAQFICEIIEPLLLPKAHALVDQHRQQGDVLLIITATNRFITEPIAGLYGIQELLATEPEMRDGAYTGKFVGIPCFQSGKVDRLNAWLAANPHISLEDSWFYSDSHNDLPLLNKVTHPVAVDPDQTLREYALAQQWPIISLR